MRLTPLRRTGLAASAAVAAVAVFALTTAATATPIKPAPDSGDPRAVAIADDKNVDINHKDACTVGGLTGTPIAPEKFTFTGGKDQLDLDITAVPANTTVTGVVVKGGDAYNVYLAPKLGALPWNDLRSPKNNGGNVPQISHWYACGITTQQSSTPITTTTTTTSSTTSTTTITVSSSPSSTASSAPSSSSVVATTTTTAAAVPVDSDDLASTGFGSAWLLGLGAALLAAGAGVLFFLRRRSA